MRYAKSRVMLAALFACLSARAQDAAPKPAVGDVLLNPLSIKLTSSFQPRARDVTFELAVRYIGDQIELRRAADAARSPLESFWKASFWRYIPFAPGGVQRATDDPFFTPAYLTTPGRQIELQMAEAEKRALFQFGH
jgi:hypothetical protein